MVNKKGWLRIIEATIAVLIIFGVLLTISANKGGYKEADLSERASEILVELSRDTAIRASVVSYNTTNLSNDFVTKSNNEGVINRMNMFMESQLKGQNIKYAIKICDPLEICPLESYPKDAREGIYANERIIVPGPYETNFTIKKVKVFLWK
jgi:hypothetical protein